MWVALCDSPHLRSQQRRSHRARFAPLPCMNSAKYCVAMPISDLEQLDKSLVAEQSNSIQRELSEAEIAEAKESLHRYFEIGWQIASRLQREGKLDEVLTEARVNPTVNPPRIDEAESNPYQAIT